MAFDLDPHRHLRAELQEMVPASTGNEDLEEDCSRSCCMGTLNTNRQRYANAGLWLFWITQAYEEPRV